MIIENQFDWKILYENECLSAETECGDLVSFGWIKSLQTGPFLFPNSATEPY